MNVRILVKKSSDYSSFREFELDYKCSIIMNFSVAIIWQRSPLVRVTEHAWLQTTLFFLKYDITVYQVQLLVES
jgi:hypothetical protein